MEKPITRKEYLDLMECRYGKQYRDDLEAAIKTIESCSPDTQEVVKSILREMKEDLDKII